MTVWRKLVAFAGLTLLFTVAVFLFIDLVWLPRSQGKFVDTVTVPSLVGLDSAQAAKQLTDVSLSIGLLEWARNDTLPKGRVAAQFPSAGHAVKTTRGIRLILSSGKEYLKVPLLLGMTPLAAGDSLQKVGLRLGEVKESFNPEIEEGTVIASSPLSGSRIARGSVVHLTVASRTTGDMAYVPSVLESSIEEARRLILQAGLVIGRVTTVRDEEMLPGTVLSQSLHAGGLVARGAPIDLTVSE